jgi:hypothetical protein
MHPRCQRVVAVVLLTLDGAEVNVFNNKVLRDPTFVFCFKTSQVEIPWGDELGLKPFGIVASKYVGPENFNVGRIIEECKGSRSAPEPRYINTSKGNKLRRRNDLIPTRATRDPGNPDASGGLDDSATPPQRQVCDSSAARPLLSYRSAPARLLLHAVQDSPQLFYDLSARLFDSTSGLRLYRRRLYRRGRENQGFS